MRKRYLIFPLIMVGCLIGTICFAANAPKGQLEEETAVTAKLPEEKLKYPYSVDQAKKETKPEVTKAVTATPTPDPTPEPTPVVTEEPELTQTAENDEDAASVDVIAEEPQTEDVPVAEDAVPVIAEEPVVEEPVYDSDFEEPVETGNYYEEIPDETSLVYQQEESSGMQLLGCYYITHYSAEACGNNIGARERPGGMVEGESIAVPEWWMLGHWFYIPNYGTFRADDISDGPFDIFHWYAADAVGAEYQDVYLVG